MTYAYAFSDKLRMSQGYVAQISVDDVLMAHVPGAVRVRVAGKSDDKNGTDYWVDRECGEALSVDVKVREKDWKPRGCDDLALETWSVLERGRVGWTLDTHKRTDYVLWLWKDTGRWCLIPFPMLCAVFQDNRDEWCGQYKVSRQYTPDGGYHSECVFVPRLAVWRAIYNRFGGN